MFLTRQILSRCGWQAFERLLARLLVHKGFSGVRVVGGSGDKGADILARSSSGKRWLIQAKYWSKPISENELQATVNAARAYKCDVAVVACPKGADDRARAFQRKALLQGHSLSIWTTDDLVSMSSALTSVSLVRAAQGAYQEAAIQAVVEMLRTGTPRRSMVVMATGLGKTFTAAEAIRRARTATTRNVLVLAHTNQLVLQLEKAFWPFLSPDQATAIWNHNERLSQESLGDYQFIFASRDSVANYIASNGEIPDLDLVLIDECHHAHSNSESYLKIIRALGAGTASGPQLLGLTATPFLADHEATLEPVFGDTPLVTIDMVYGLRHGFLSRVDYRMFTDNINWNGLTDLQGKRLSPKQINRTFFIKEWDDGVVTQLQSTWSEIANPKAIVFCGTIEHAKVMRDKINSRGFASAAAIYSGSGLGGSMSQYERNIVLSDFEAGLHNIICAVDVFNEGIDVPDVNIVVFNRVTHSRRIFIQQLGRGLRLSPGKDRAIVLDFAQDIRRFAAGIKLKNDLHAEPSVGAVEIGNRVTFRNASSEDKLAESYLRDWLTDVESIELSGDDEVGVLPQAPQFTSHR